MIKRFLAEENGATAIEYGLIVALVGVALLTGVGAMGNSMFTVFNTSSDDVEEVARCVQVGSNCKK